MSKNKSHRKYIKERTNQIVNLYPVASKPELRFNKPSKDHIRVDNCGDDTSFALNSSRDTSLSKKLKLKDSTHQGKQKSFKKMSKYYLKLEKPTFNRPISKIKSEEVLPFKSPSTPNSRKAFSVRKHSKLSISKHNTESVESKREKKEGWKQKNDSYLGNLKTTQNLKKTSTKLKLKVKDPFERKMKLDNQFQDQSQIAHQQESFISTINEEQFRDILNKIT